MKHHNTPTRETLSICCALYSFALMGCSADVGSPDGEAGVREQALATPTSQQDVAVFLVQTQSPANPPLSLEDVNQALAETDSFFSEQSYGRFDLNWEDNVHVVQYTFENCNSRGVLEDGVVEQAEAEIPGFDRYDYDHIMFFVDVNTDCGAAAGARGTQSHSGYYSAANPEAVAHETGHTLGLPHARGLLCVDSNGNFTSLTGTCQTQEYGDRLDVMGTANFLHFSTYSKGLLGWLSTDQQVVASSGDIMLSPVESNSTGIKSLFVPIPGSAESYHLELRTESLIGPQIVVRKIVGESTVLINASPESGTDWQNMERAGLLPGAPLYDAASGITLTAISLSETAAEVRIETESPTCTTESATSLGSRGSASWVASDACIMIDSYPSYFQWGPQQVSLQVRGTGNFPLAVSYEDACTGAGGNFTFTGAWQQQSVGAHQLGCPTLIQLGGDGSPVEFTWY